MAVTGVGTAAGALASAKESCACRPATSLEWLRAKRLRPSLGVRCVAGVGVDERDDEPEAEALTAGEAR
jgi:hypothetical protein